MKYSIALDGCDDSTEFDLELKEEEYILLKKISNISKQVSQYRCMPVLEIDPSTENPIRSRHVEKELSDGA